MTRTIIAFGIITAWFAAVPPDAAARRRPLTLQTGAQPNSIVAAHFNRDRKLDLVVANQDSDTISVFLGRGNGRFAQARTFPTGPGPASIRAADFNHDGDLDLVTANIGSNTVSILLGNGKGGFEPPVEVPTTDCDTCGTLAVLARDLNEDSHVDLAMALVGSNVIGVLLGHGDGSFPVRIDEAGFVRDDPQFLVSDDFNDDGTPDLATANFDFVSVSTLLGNGDGTFIGGPEFATGSFSFGIAVADLNRDGIPDLVVANHERTGPFPFGRDSVSVLLGDGTGGFAAHIETAAGLRPVYVTTADFNRDGDIDVAVANFAGNSVSLLLGSGDGNLGERRDLATGAGPTAITTGDFDRNGTTDLAVVNRTAGTVSLLFLE